MHKKLWNKDYILMLQGNAVSQLGDILYSVAIGYWVYEKTGSSALMGIMSSISMFMTMIVMPFSGSIIDKCDRKLVIVGADALRGVLMLAVSAFAFAGKLTVPLVLLAAFLASACTVFFNPAASTLMLDIIPHDDMVRGQSVQSGVLTALSLVGKAVSGALTAFLGVPLIIAINGLSYLISAFTEVFITVPKTPAQGESIGVRKIFSDLGLGVREVLETPALRLFIPSVILVNFLGAGPMTLMLPFVLDKGFTVDMYGYLMSVEMAATFLCVCILSIVKLKPGVRYYSMAASFLLASAFCIIGYGTGSYALMCAMLFLGGFLNTVGNSIFNAALMLALPEANRGAILGFVNAASTGGTACSAVVFGFLCDRFPIPAVFIGATLVSMLPLGYMCLHKTTKEFVLTH